MAAAAACSQFAKGLTLLGRFCLVQVLIDGKDLTAIFTQVDGLKTTIATLKAVREDTLLLPPPCVAPIRLLSAPPCRSPPDLPVHRAGMHAGIAAFRRAAGGPPAGAAGFVSARRSFLRQQRC